MTTHTDGDSERQRCDAARQLARACQAALAYLADPPSAFEANRAEAARIITTALASARKAGLA